MIATAVLLTLGAVAANPFEAEISAAVEDVRAVWPVPPALVRAVIRQESAFNPRAKSSAGAIGLMQLMPANAAKLGFTEAELWEPAKNVLAGTRFLAVLLKHYDGDLISALVAYNAHPMKLGAPIPRNGETPDYVVRVLRFYFGYLKDEASGERASVLGSREGSLGGLQLTAKSSILEGRE
jgi:soluble lytic murein transglycosylase-like protein